MESNMRADEEARGSGDNGTMHERIVDARVGLLLLGEARRLLTKRLFGVSRRDSSLVALIAVAALADTLALKARRIRSVPRRPTPTEALFAAAGLKEAAHRLAGPTSRDAQDFGTLISVVVVGATIGAVVRPPLRSFRAASRRTRAELARVSGGLVGHPRVRAIVAATPAARVPRRRAI
jgi:hypothetical protein